MGGGPGACRGVEDAPHRTVFTQGGRHAAGGARTATLAPASASEAPHRHVPGGQALFVRQARRALAGRAAGARSGPSAHLMGDRTAHRVWKRAASTEKAAGCAGLRALCSRQVSAVPGGCGRALRWRAELVERGGGPDSCKHVTARCAAGIRADRGVACGCPAFAAAQCHSAGPSCSAARRRTAKNPRPGPDHFCAPSTCPAACPGSGMNDQAVARRGGPPAVARPAAALPALRSPCLAGPTSLVSRLAWLHFGRQYGHALHEWMNGAVSGMHMRKHHSTPLLFEGQAKSGLRPQPGQHAGAASQQIAGRCGDCPCRLPR